MIRNASIGDLEKTNAFTFVLMFSTFFISKLEYQAPPSWEVDWMEIESCLSNLD